MIFNRPACMMKPDGILRLCGCGAIHQLVTPINADDTTPGSFPLTVQAATV
jgi:hypothetical protein